MKSICRFILRVIGWKIGGSTDIPKKCVICVAPHTSNWDFPLGLIIYTSLGNHASFLMKKDWFFFPMNLIFSLLGGIPVDRSKKTSLTEQMAKLYAKNERFQLAITPEGTRKLNAEWKKGFYFIAQAAHVPIVVTTLDYAKKEVEFKKIMMPTGDVDADMIEIKSYYKGVTACHPENFSI